MARLTSTDDLRRVIAEPRPATRSKILDALDEQSIDFLKRCPFALVSTTAADGTIEVSPKGDEPGFIRVENPKTLLIPERVGNNLAFGLSNILATGTIGLIALGPAPGRISFGKIIAPRIGADATVAAQIDAGVEGAYTTRLWSNS
jgi:predicted pyridoxine 5'-phosphate oxidase superfamily flavin-nucleotide-binding protein